MSRRVYNTGPVPGFLYRSALLVAVLLFSGCGSSPPEVDATEAEYLQVIDLEGNQRVVAPGELMDSETGEPAVAQVLSIDRKTGEEEWVDVELVFETSPALARYTPVTQAERASPSE